MLILLLIFRIAEVAYSEHEIAKCLYQFLINLWHVQQVSERLHRVCLQLSKVDAYNLSDKIWSFLLFLLVQLLLQVNLFEKQIKLLEHVLYQKL